MLTSDHYQFAAAEIRAIGGAHLDDIDRAELLALTAIVERRGTAARALGDDRALDALVDLVGAVETLYRPGAGQQVPL